MNKKKTIKPAASAPEKADKKKRSTLKLALLALAPLLLAAGGYAGWAYYAGAAAAEGEPDAMQVAAIAPEVAAETSYTHSYALSVLVARLCGTARVPGLRAASEAEARADGMLVNLSWLAAARRVAMFTGVSCDFLRQEVREAEFRAEKMLQDQGKPVAH